MYWKKAVSEAFVSTQHTVDCEHIETGVECPAECPGFVWA